MLRSLAVLAARVAVGFATAVGFAAVVAGFGGGDGKAKSARRVFVTFGSPCLSGVLGLDMPLV